jgi:predicted MFS family arabinose efflux permease
MKKLLHQTFGGLSKEIWFLSLVMLINRSGTMVIAFMSVYLSQELGFSIPQTGVIMVAYGLGSLTGTWLGGKLSDIFGSFPVQFFSQLLGGIMFLVVSQTENYVFLIITSFLLSTLGEAYRPANTSAIAEFSNPGNFTRSVSLVRLAINLGWALGPALGGLLASVNYKWLFYVDGITNIFAAGLVFVFLRKPIKNKIKNRSHEIKNVSVFKDKVFVWFIVFVTFYAIAFFQIFTIGPLFFKRDCGFSEKEIGILIGINGLLVVMIEMILISKIDGKFPKLKLISFGTFLLIINFIIFVFSHNYWILMIALVFATFSEIFAMPYMNTFSLERANEHNRGAYSSWYSMAWAIATVSSPLMSTQIIDRLGFSYLWGLLGIFSIISMAGFIWIHKKIRISNLKTNISSV